MQFQLTSVIDQTFDKRKTCSIFLTVNEHTMNANFLLPDEIDKDFFKVYLSPALSNLFEAILGNNEILNELRKKYNYDLGKMYVEWMEQEKLQNANSPV